MGPRHDGERFFEGYWEGDRGRREHDLAGTAPIIAISEAGITIIISNGRRDDDGALTDVGSAAIGVSFLRNR
jgi:hypothetical protein